MPVSLGTCGFSLSSGHNSVLVFLIQEVCKCEELSVNISFSLNNGIIHISAVNQYLFKGGLLCIKI